jgi:hypothetical protein
MARRYPTCASGGSHRHLRLIHVHGYRDNRLVKNKCISTKGAKKRESFIDILYIQTATVKRNSIFVYAYGQERMLGRAEGRRMPGGKNRRIHIS